MYKYKNVAGLHENVDDPICSMVAVFQFVSNRAIEPLSYRGIYFV